MLEYETANPGQDRSKPKGEHSHAPSISSAPEDYAMEEAFTPVGRSGIPREYGTEERPFTGSPRPPHPNDQYTGLTDGGMHGGETSRPTESTRSRGPANNFVGNARRGDVTSDLATNPGNRGGNGTRN